MSTTASARHTERIALAQANMRSPLLSATGGSAFDKQQRRSFWPFVLPALIVYVIIMVAPTVFTLWMSLNVWAGAGPMEFVGVQNYSRMFRDPIFLTSFANTLWIVFGVGAAVFAIAFCMTMAMHDMLARKFVRAVIFFPSLVPGIAISIIWGFLFNPDGLVNGLLRFTGVTTFPSWLGQDHIFQVVLLGLVWLSTGTYTVIFMSAVDRIPAEIYDAAEIDGIGPLRRFTSITLPLIGDVVGVCSVLWCVGALKTFEFLLTFSSVSGALPPTEVWNFAVYSYAAAFNPTGVANYGMAAASGVILLILTLVLTVFVQRVLSKRDTVSL